MPYEITYLDKDGGVITTYWGEITDNDVIESAKEKYASIDRLKSYRYGITDLSRVDTFNLTSKGVQLNAKISAEIFKEKGDAIVAFVLPTDAQYGMGRMWQAYGDRDDSKSFVCRTRAEAEEWIKDRLKE